MDAEAWTDSQLERKRLVESGLTVVASLRSPFNDAALIACATQNGLTKRIDRQTAWGNPFVMNKESDRASSCESYADWFSQQRKLKILLPGLKGKVLLCWCYPKQCHGDYLAELANKTECI